MLHVPASMAVSETETVAPSRVRGLLLLGSKLVCLRLSRVVPLCAFVSRVLGCLFVAHLLRSLLSMPSHDVDGSRHIE